MGLKRAKMTKFIAIASGKGGVGKTTTALNLGTALSNFGKDVVVVDANLSTPNIALHLGSPKLNITLNDSMRGRVNIKDAAYLHPSGVRIIPSSISFDDMEGINPNSLHETLLGLVGSTELVILDTAGGIGEESKAAIISADEVIVVVNPDMLSIADALKTIRIAEERGIKVTGAIMNRVKGDSFELSRKNVEALLDKPVIGMIPEDNSVFRSLALKHPVVYTHPDSGAAIGFKKLAAKIMGQEYLHDLAEKRQ